MKRKNSFFDLKMCYCICSTLAVLMLGVALFNKPKPVVQTQYIKERVNLTVDSGKVEKTDRGFIASGTGIHLIDISSEFNQTKYAQEQWLVFARYGLEGSIGIGCQRRIVGPFWAGIGLDTSLPILPVIERYRASVYVGVTF
jgi:hypothetical protein